MENTNQLEKRQTDWTLILVLALLSVGVLFFIVWVSHFPSYVINHGYKDHFDTSSGVIGDTFGGLMGPPIAIMGAVLTFFAFAVQFWANQIQRSQFKISLIEQKNQINSQEKNWKQERFESRFFELIRLHKDNLSEMNLAYNVTGRKCFASMFYEFKSIYSIIDDEISTQKRINGTSYANVDILKMAYNIFFWGIGYNSERSYLDEFTKDEQKLFNSFGDGVRKRLDQKKKSVISAIKLDDRLPEKAEDWSIHYRYVPYDGHANILGHYYRHLFQTAKYITDNVDLEPNQKREYLKNLRAQLSNFEQLMLFYNATIWFPQEWKELFTTYRFIKNVPVELVDMGPSPLKIYKEEMIALWENENKKMFEGQGDISELLSKEKTAEVKSN